MSFTREDIRADTKEIVGDAIRDLVNSMEGAIERSRHQGSAEIEATTAEIRDEIKGATGQIRDELKTTAATIRGEIKATAAEIRDEIKVTTRQVRAEIKASASATIDEITEVIRDVVQMTSDTAVEHDRRLDGHEHRLRRLEGEIGE